MNPAVSVWHLGAALHGIYCALLSPVAAAPDTVTAWLVPGHAPVPAPAVYNPGAGLWLLLDRACVALVVTVVAYEVLLRRRWLPGGWFTPLFLLEYGLGLLVLLVGAHVWGPVASFPRWGWLATSSAVQGGLTALLAVAARRWALRSPRP